MNQKPSSRGSRTIYYGTNLVTPTDDNQSNIILGRDISHNVVDFIDWSLELFLSDSLMMRMQGQPG